MNKNLPAEHPSIRHYLKIFAWLAILTVLELGVAIIYQKFHLYPKSALVIALVGLAVLKAALVAMHFMHLKMDSKSLTLVIVIPLIMLMILGGLLSFESLQAHHVHDSPETPSTPPAHQGE